MRKWFQRWGIDVIGGGESAVIALALARSSSHRSGAEPAMAPLDFEWLSRGYKRLKAVLEADGLWDASQYGLWSVPYVSY